MTETTEPTREQIEEIRADYQPGDVVYGLCAMALRTLDAEAQLAAMTERAELAETLLGASNAAVDALRATTSAIGADMRAIRDAAMTHAGEFMRGGETAAPAIERMATALREATERAERLQRHFDEAAPEHNLPALLDLYAERERAATERAEKAERELADALQKADVFGELIKSIFYTLNHKLERRIDRDYRKMADTVREQINDLRYIVDQRERAEKAERERDEATERAERAERERDVSRSALNSIVSELRDALGDFPMVGEKWTDAVKRLRKQLAEVDLDRDEAVYVMREMRVAWDAASAQRDDLRTRLADAERLLAEVGRELSIKDARIAVVCGQHRALCTKLSNMHRRAQRAESATAAARREAIGQRMRAEWWRGEAKRLGWTPDYPELREDPPSDARLDCESSSLLLLSTWARRVMMRPKNRAKGVPSESVEELIVMARKELSEARDAIEEDATTDDILAELGDAAAIIGFAMREIEKRRKA